MLSPAIFSRLELEENCKEERSVAYPSRFLLRNSQRLHLSSIWRCPGDFLGQVYFDSGGFIQLNLMDGCALWIFDVETQTFRKISDVFSFELELHTSTSGNVLIVMGIAWENSSPRYERFHIIYLVTVVPSQMYMISFLQLKTIKCTCHVVFLYGGQYGKGCLMIDLLQIYCTIHIRTINTKKVLAYLVKHAIDNQSRDTQESMRRSIL